MNYVTPGYATAVFVSAAGVQRIRTTAESHRRIAIVEVMGRHSGYIALGAAYGQPDILLVPEHRLNVDLLVERIKEIYDLQKHCVIVCGEGIVDEKGEELGAEHASTDPAGNVILSGASEALRGAHPAGSATTTSRASGATSRPGRRSSPVRSGHTQRGGRPILFDRFHAAQLGGHARGHAARRADERRRDPAVHPRPRVPPRRCLRQRLPRPLGPDPRPHDAPELLRPGRDAAEPDGDRLPDADLHPTRSGPTTWRCCARELFDPSHLKMPFHSVNTDIGKRIRYVRGEGQATRRAQAMRWPYHVVMETSATETTARRHPEDRAPVVAPLDLPEDGREAGRGGSRRARSWTSTTGTGSGWRAASTTATRASPCAS